MRFLVKELPRLDMIFPFSAIRTSDEGDCNATYFFVPQWHPRRLFRFLMLVCFMHYVVERQKNAVEKLQLVFEM